LLIASANSIYLLTGLPRQNGELVSLTRSIGILGQGAWTQALSTIDELYFLSKVGVMRMETESLRRDLVAAPISRKYLPDELFGLSHEYLNPSACLGFDSRWNTIHITDRTAELSYMLDVRNNVFFRQSFSSYPTVMRNFDSLLSDDASGLLFGGAGYGGVARFDRTGSEAFESFQIVGPVQISESPSRAGVIQRANVILGGGTDDLGGTVKFFTAGTARSALLRALSDTDNYSHSVDIENQIQNIHTSAPKLRGHATVIVIRGSGSAGKRIVSEGYELEVVDKGRTRDPGLLPPVVTPPPSTFTLATS
jgi:hypothetical protein